MITVSFLGQDIPMSKYVYAYGACLRLFDSYKKRLLQCFDAMKGNGREAIEKGINEEIDRIVNDVIGKAMSEDIYSVASSDIRKNQAYMTYIEFCKSHRWRSEYYDQCYRELKEVLCGVIDGMMKCYLTILEENERFDSTRIEKFSREHSDEIISLLQNSPDKVRTIKVMPKVMTCLREVRKKQLEMWLRMGSEWQNVNDLVFTHADGRNYCDAVVRKHFKKIVKRMGLPNLRVHDLRHTFATLALQGGVDYKTLSNALGHSDVAFTMNQYAHVSEAMRDNMITKLEAVLGAN